MEADPNLERNMPICQEKILTQYSKLHDSKVSTAQTTQLLLQSFLFNWILLQGHNHAQVSFMQNNKNLPCSHFSPLVTVFFFSFMGSLFKKWSIHGICTSLLVIHSSIFSAYPPSTPLF